MSFSWVIDTLRRVSADLSSHQDGRHIAPDLLKSCILSLELALNALDGNGDQACQLVRQALLTLQDIEHLQLAQSVASSPDIRLTGSVGRPRLEIPREQLVWLIYSKFTIPQMAEIIGVSVRTIHRQMSKYGLSIHTTYAGLTDNELDSVISEIHREFPMCGNKQMGGHLFSRGLRVQQHRIRESMRVDPEGTMARRLNVIHRRCYSVPAPRSLYHIDGNHKLIR